MFLTSIRHATQGRLLHWHPEKVQAKKALPASYPGLLARFAKESSLNKREMFPDIDHIDVIARQETITNVRGNPVLVQVPVVPCYSLTVHKTQALSIKHLVLGCLEGVFALGQIYVLFSRVTDPQNLVLIGLPPKDLLDAVAAAWEQAGLNVDECFRRAVSVTNEWTYAAGNGNTDRPVVERISPKWMSERVIPQKLRNLSETLNPQPLASTVIRELLDWIDRVDFASQRGLPSPPFKTRDGQDIFPEEKWWLTDVQRKEDAEGDKDVKGDEDGPASSVGEADLEDAALDDALTNDEDPLSDVEATEANSSKKDHKMKSYCPFPAFGDHGENPCEATPITSAFSPTKKRSLDSATTTEPSFGVQTRIILPEDSATEGVSSFMRACGKNPDPSIPPLAPSGPGHHCTGCRRSWRADDLNTPFGGVCDRCHRELQDGMLQATTHFQPF